MELDLKNSLNEPQFEATSLTEGPLVVFAGAGSGKTRVLTYRYANIIAKGNADIDNILSVTFTNKAAAEMAQRIGKLIQRNIASSWISTFHSFCAKILRRHAECLGYTPNFAILDSSESLAVLKRVIKQLGYDPKIHDPRTIKSKIEKAKNNYKGPEDIVNDSGFELETDKIAAEVFTAYQKELLSSNCMDFSDLLCNVVTLFKMEKDILTKYANQFKYIMVDEYQDTNQVQYILVKALSQIHKNICIVGDDDQSIYAFRGATPANINKFKRDFPEHKEIVLNVNYRSSKNILTLASNIIEQNRNRKTKNLTTPNEGGDKVKIYAAGDEKLEAEYICRQVELYKSKGGQLKDIAIFYRTNAQSRMIEEFLSRNTIPYRIFGSVRFYDRKEIKDVVAYLRVLIDGNQKESFLRIINTPARGIGAKAVSPLEAACNINNCSFEDVLINVKDFIKNGDKSNLLKPLHLLSPSQMKKIDSFYSFILESRDKLHKAEEKLSSTSHSSDEKAWEVANFMLRLMEKSKYIAALEKKGMPEDLSKIENIREFSLVAQEFVIDRISKDQDASITAFLNDVSLASDMDIKAEGEDDFVSLMTLHLAKGLEYDLVFFAGLEEGLIPHSRSFYDNEALEEERRLCYVGITRAQRTLHLLHAETRRSYRGGFSYSRRSRFLDDLPQDCMEDMAVKVYFSER